ncbi:MAG TPA: SCO2525 family SAM-dependent methyltransferase [Pseudonocardiaceae bacterium]
MPDQDAQVAPTHAPAPPRNEEIQWDSFNPEAYCDHNYGTLRDDDRQILRLMADFFSTFGHHRLKKGVDVGAGANLYPTLAMLPFCRRIILRERAERNCSWLRDEVKDYSAIWDPYWQELATRPHYAPIADPRWTVQERVSVQRGSIFNLPQREYDIGTMFFVAESITEWDVEFHRATEKFFGSLRLRAPFAAAFMLSSSGYYVDGVRFPAVAIDEEHVRQSLKVAGIKDFVIHEIKSDTPLRKDVGMMLVTGTGAPR